MVVVESYLSFRTAKDVDETEQVVLGINLDSTEHKQMSPSPSPSPSPPVLSVELLDEVGLGQPINN